jgi:hypothetical protein
MKEAVTTSIQELLQLTNSHKARVACGHFDPANRIAQTLTFFWGKP